MMQRGGACWARGRSAVLLLLVTTASIAATTDPLPSNNRPLTVSSAEGAGAGRAEGRAK